MSRYSQNNKINFYGICYALPIKCIVDFLPVFISLWYCQTQRNIGSFSVIVPFKISILEAVVITMLRLQLSQEIIFVHIL